MSTSGLPSDVSNFIEWVGRYAESYGGNLNYRERDRIKADMMNVPARWKASRVTPDALGDKVLAVGMKDKNAAEVAGFLRRVQDGKGLRPKYYKDYRWPEDPTDD